MKLLFLGIIIAIALMCLIGCVRNHYPAVVIMPQTQADLKRQMNEEEMLAELRKISSNSSLLKKVIILKTKESSN
jgi:hypothetical protein